ncbi:MAG: secretin N-terminal domain-containing protein [Candidatus Omnitrophota bacterium]
MCTCGLICPNSVAYGQDTSASAVVEGENDISATMVEESEDDADESGTSNEENADVAAAATDVEAEDDTQKKKEPSEKAGHVTLDFKEADILLVLRLLSLKSGKNIVAGPEVAGTVTIRLHDVPWEKALDVVLRTYGYVYERDGNIIRVTTRENLEAEELVTETFVLNYSTAAEVEDSISEIISERGRLKSVTRTNTIIVTDISTNIYKIGEIIKRLDKRTPQVYIDAKIVETSQKNTDVMGVHWGNQSPFTATASSRNFTFPWKTTQGGGLSAYLPGDVGFTQDAGDDVTPYGFSDEGVGTLDMANFAATLNLLKSFTDTKIINNPRIVVLSNQTAKVQIGWEYPIPSYERNETTASMEITGYEARDVGTVLKVTPHVNDANEILVEVEPEVSAWYENQSFGNTTAPVFSTTTAQTQVLIKDGETIAIGGLISDSMSESKQKVPILGDIPFIGRMFRHRDSSASSGKKETIFFITVTIIDTEGQPEYSIFS